MLARNGYGVLLLDMRSYDGSESGGHTGGREPEPDEHERRVVGSFDRTPLGTQGGR